MSILPSFILGPNQIAKQNKKKWKSNEGIEVFCYEFSRPYWYYQCNAGITWCYHLAIHPEQCNPTSTSKWDLLSKSTSVNNQVLQSSRIYVLFYCRSSICCYYKSYNYNGRIRIGHIKSPFVRYWNFLIGM